MSQLSKRSKAILEKITLEKVYQADEAIQILKDCAAVKFKESMDVSVNLGVDPRKSDQVVRGATLLPHGSGREVKVAVFAGGDLAKLAEQAGADQVGLEDLAEVIKQGQFDFNVLIATPDAMRLVGSLGKILGPRGLMPNPKVGTVTKDVATAVKNAKAGQVRYRTDKGGIIHCTIGKIDFDVTALRENLRAIIADLRKAKPAQAKGTYFKKITLSTTMGPGLTVDQSSVEL